jgi:hypothetical protein
MMNTRKNRNGRLRLHPKHGLAPTIPVCWYCGEEKNEVVLLGAKWKGKAAPPARAIVDHEPCEVCEKWMKRGIMLLRAVPGTESAPKRVKSGQLAVVKEGWLDAIEDLKLREKVRRERVLYISDDVWEAAGLPAPVDNDDSWTRGPAFKDDDDGESPS